MIKFLDKSFSSRPASQAYRDNYEATFGTPQVIDDVAARIQPIDEGTTPAPEGQIYVCSVDGRTSKTRYGFDADGVPCADPGWDSSCASNASLYLDNNTLRRVRADYASLG